MKSDLIESDQGERTIAHQAKASAEDHHASIAPASADQAGRQARNDEGQLTGCVDQTYELEVVAQTKQVEVEQHRINAKVAKPKPCLGDQA